MYDVLQQEVCAQGVGSGPTPMDDGAVRNAASFRCFLHGAQLRTWYLRGVEKHPNPSQPNPLRLLAGWSHNTLDRRDNLHPTGERPQPGGGWGVKKEKG